MNNKLRNSGFSLTEVLLSVGTLAIGMSFIAGVFPVAIYLTTISSERTTAAIVADEAFGKIGLYEPNLPGGGLVPIQTLCSIGQGEFFYPSTEELPVRKQYSWSALCRRVEPVTREVQVTVFVCRRVGGGTAAIWPVEVAVSQDTVGDNELRITDDKRLINDGYMIVENSTGDIYRVLERYASADDVILLDRQWDPENKYSSPYTIRVIPPLQFGGRYPCVAIYQKVIRF